jgi:hypothetical protein
LIDFESNYAGGVALSDMRSEVWKNFREAQDKHTYFILAAAGSAIAFSVHVTLGRSLSWSMIPLGVSVAAWALSFWAGCRVIAYVNSSTYANHALLEVREGSHPDLTTGHPAEIAAASEGIRKAIEFNSAKLQFWDAWQFRLLALGAAAFLAWHILDMGLRASTAVPTIQPVVPARARSNAIVHEQTM